MALGKGIGGVEAFVRGVIWGEAGCNVTVVLAVGEAERESSEDLRRNNFRMNEFSM